MVQYRVRIDVENVKVRLSRSGQGPVSEADVVAWLDRAGIRQQFPFSSLPWVAAEEALDVLRPWEVLERLPLLILPAEAFGPGLGA